MKPVDIQEGILHSDSGLTTRLVVAVFLFFLFPHIVCFLIVISMHTSRFSGRDRAGMGKEQKEKVGSLAFGRIV
jgi:hypothetical protein